jgi:hypothetical protein
MKSTRVFTSILSLALAGLLLASGCKKQSQQPSPDTTATASQPAVPPPPADQSAPPPATSPSTATPATPPPSSSAAAPSSAPASAPPNEAAAAPPPAEPPPPPPPLVIPAGTHIAVTIQQDLGSKISQPGQTFSATVASPIIINGQRAIRAGASATGTVVDAKALGHFKGGAYLALRLDTVRAMGSTYQVSTSTLERVEQGKGKRTAGLIGGGAGLGAIIGGVAGGGKGALIGGLVGGGAGTAGAGLTGKKDIVIPAETTLTFRLARSVHVSQ